MTRLVQQLGLAPTVAFHDVYSISDPDLLAFVPRPAYALLLVFPISSTYEKFRRREDEDRPEYDGSGEGEEVMWFKQTIRNACGLIGLLHAVSNGPVKDFIGNNQAFSFPEPCGTTYPFEQATNQDIRNIKIQTQTSPSY